ncbi:MAG: nucleotidyltransferase [bacterium]
MELPRDFEQFLKEIRPTENQREDLKAGHKTLRERLRADEELSPLIVSDFLQGSYKRATAVRPKADKRADVDIIVVTNLDENKYNPHQAIDLFKPFVEKHYKGKYRIQGRSIGIELSYVDLDRVVTSAPSAMDSKILLSEALTTDFDIEEARDWRLHPSWLGLDSRLFEGARDRLANAQRDKEWESHPLRIPDRDANKWEDTHPLEQIRWTRDKNAASNGHFVNVVKAIKWWRMENPSEPEQPKSFPLERLVGECCRDDIGSIAEGIVTTLEAIVSNYASAVASGSKPKLPDYGVSMDVFRRVSVEDFAGFYRQAKDGAAIGRLALDSNDRGESGDLWGKLLGSKFPGPPVNGGKKSGGFTRRAGITIPGAGRFA